MQKPRFSRYIILGLAIFIIITVLTCRHFYDLHRQQVEQDLRRQTAMRRLSERLDAFTLVLSSEMARDAQKIAIPEIRAACIGTNNGGTEKNIVDPDPELLRRLKASVDKIQPYSWCRELPDKWQVLTYTIFIEGWESEEHAEFGVLQSSGVHSTVESSEIYELILRDGHWKIVRRSTGPPS